MNKRLASLNRIADVKKHQRRAAEWRLARTRRQVSATLEDQHAVIAALNADQPLHGLFVDTMARHLSILSERLDALRRAETRQVAELDAQTAQLKQVERMLKNASRLQGRADGWKELSEVIDAAMARDDASLP